MSHLLRLTSLVFFFVKIEDGDGEKAYLYHSA